MRRTWGVTTILVAVAALLVALGSAQAQAVTVRIMPLGDSITDGYNVPGGYRIDLEDELVADGRVFDFVGSLSNGPAALADKNHEGHSGWRIDQIGSSINGWLAASQPEVVLLMIGTNDVVQDYQLATAPDRLAALLDQIHTARPQAHLLVASIPPLPGATDDQQVRAYNSAIPGLVQTRAGQGRSIRYVEIHGALTTADLADGVHPSASGYSKVADLWHAALAPIFGGNQPPSASLTAPGSGTTFALGEDAVIAATASDPEGSVARVEFLANGREVGEDTSVPYSFTWVDPPAGGHTLIARAVDSTGATASSASVWIRVEGPPGSLYRAVNLGGPAVTIDGVVWEAGTAANVSTADIVYENQAAPVEPATDPSRAFMLRSVIWGSSLSRASLLNMPSGSFDAFVSIWEDNNSATSDVRIEGQLVRQGYQTGAQGHWERLGPFRVFLSDGNLDLTAGPDTNLSGLEVFSVGAGGAPSITTTTLPSGTVGVAYSATLEATGGTPPYAWSLVSGGALPPGLSLSSTTGAISGTPTTVGTSSFTARVTDNAAQGDTQPLSIAVGGTPSPTITTTNLAGGAVGVAYSQMVEATGGTPSYTWSVDPGGSLPSGLSLNVTTGAITGTPTSAGTSTFTLRVRDSASQTDTQALTLTVSAGASLAITTPSLPAGIVATFYSQSLQASGGTPPYAWSLVSGNLPRGLALTASGAISGTPTKQGMYNFTVRVTAGTQATRSFAIRINR